jgi:hypothetical protein
MPAWIHGLAMTSLLFLAGCGGRVDPNELSDGGSEASRGTTVTCTFHPTDHSMGDYCLFAITNVGPVPPTDTIEGACTAGMPAMTAGPGSLSDEPCSSNELLGCCEYGVPIDGGTLLSGACVYSPTKNYTCGSGDSKWMTSVPR